MSTAIATLSGPAFSTELSVRTHSLHADEPRDAGGADSGPAPSEYLLCALASCKAITLRMYASRKSWPLQAVRVKVSRRPGNPGERETFEVDLALEGSLTDEQRARLREIAGKCPVHRTLAAGVNIVEKAPA